jgi:hypothetical protein
LLAGYCERGDEPSGSGATELVSYLVNWLEYVSTLGFCHIIFCFPRLWVNVIGLFEHLHIYRLEESIRMELLYCNTYSEEELIGIHISSEDSEESDSGELE